MAFNRQSLWRRTAIVAAGPVANLLLAVLLYAAAHWIGVEEPKAVLSAPAPASLAERPGCAPATGCAPVRVTGRTGPRCAR